MGKDPTYDATNPSWSPDSLVMLMGYGPRVVGANTTHTIDLSLGAKKPVAMYKDSMFSAMISYGLVPILSPRLSPDGTRLAIGTTRHVWAARRNMNLPPVITRVNGVPVADTAATIAIAAPQGAMDSYALTVADDEGDPISSQAFFLQDGMTYMPSIHTLSWTPQAPVGTKFHVKFLVTTGSGGSDAILAIFTVTEPPPPGGGGCPYVDVRTRDGWRVENSILVRSLDGNLVDDVYRLNSVPEAVSGRYRLRIREDEHEFTTLDRVRLAVVDHAPGARVWPLGNRFIVGERIPPHRVTTRDGLDVTHQVDATGGPSFVGMPGETLTVDLVPAFGLGSSTGAGDGQVQPIDLDPFEMDTGIKDPGDGEWRAPEQSLVASVTNPTAAQSADAAILAATGIDVQGPNADGTWTTVRRHYPRAQHDAALVDTLDQGPVRLAFAGRHELHFVGRVVPASSVTPTMLAASRASHSRSGNVAAAVSADGGTTASLVPGDTLDLEFEAPPIGPGQVRDLFLAVRGAYTSASPGALRALREAAPARFALHQNRPNPFDRSTEIRFDLPERALVTIEVFDAAGRRMRTLEHREYAPGRWSVEWNRHDASGRPAAAGIYWYRLSAGSLHAERRMVLLPE